MIRAIFRKDCDLLDIEVAWDGVMSMAWTLALMRTRGYTMSTSFTCLLELTLTFLLQLTNLDEIVPSLSYDMEASIGPHLRQHQVSPLLHSVPQIVEDC